MITHNKNYSSDSKGHASGSVLTVFNSENTFNGRTLFHEFIHSLGADDHDNGNCIMSCYSDSYTIDGEEWNEINYNSCYSEP